MGLREKLESLKERLLDPFNVEGLEKEFEELLEMMRNSDPEEIRNARKDFEEVRELLIRNVEIISGSMRPLVERAQRGLFSRRV